MLSILVFVHSIQAQEQFGLTHGNFAGVDGGAMNPARLAGQWSYASIRLIGADLFVWNDMVALSGQDHTLMGEVRDGMRGTPGDLVLRESLRSDLKQGFVQVGIPGPAFSLSLGKGSLSAGIRSRSATSVTGISPELGRFLFHGSGYSAQHGIRYRDEGTRALTAAWTEVGLAYARIISSEGFGLVSAGASLRYQQAHLGGLLQFDVFDYTVLDTMRATVHDLSGSFGFASPSASAGRGWGADIGVQYERTMEEADRYVPHHASTGCKPMPYRYRIGLSVIDLGANYFKRAMGGFVNGGTTTIADLSDIDMDGAEALDSLFGTVANWTTSDKFLIGDPTAVALQYDQRLFDRAYVAFDLVQQLSSRHGSRLRRPNSVAITPRFDTRWFEASIPIVFHEYVFTRPSVGLLLRFSDLSIGSDHILPFLTRPNVSGADIYFRLRITIARSPFCRGKRRSGAKHTSGSTEALPCVLPGD